MPQKGWIIRALIASPSDCIEERKVIADKIADWNASHSEGTNAIIESVKWETLLHPEMGDRPQAIINRQIVDRSDFIVAAFGARLGTPSAEALSGTVEEIECFVKAGKPTLVYFSAGRVSLDDIDFDQLKALKEYQKKIETEGIYTKYESPVDFASKFARDLASAMVQILKTVSPDAGTTAAEIDAATLKNSTTLASLSSLEICLVRLRIEWEAERDSDPPGIDGGKSILGQTADELLQVRAHCRIGQSGAAEALEDAISRIRKLQRHRLFTDGGISFHQFWKEGDEIVASFAKIEELLEKENGVKRVVPVRRPKEQIAILQMLSPATGTQLRHIEGTLSIPIKPLIYHLQSLEDEGLVESVNYSRDPLWDSGSVAQSLWLIRQPGLRYLAAEGLLNS